MRVVVHDFVGHAFPLDLSRALARRGHAVRHVFCSSFPAGRGEMTPSYMDPVSFEIVPIALPSEFSRYSFGRRVVQEVRYARELVRIVNDFHPDVILDSSPALVARTWSVFKYRRRRIPDVQWLQDISSIAIREQFEKKLGRVGGVISRFPTTIEAWLLRDAAHVVSISADFVPWLGNSKVDPNNVTVIPNWGPVNDIRPVDRSLWRARRAIDERRIALYAGTLGLKHNPRLLLELALSVRDLDTAVIVASEGMGAELLRAEGAELPNLHVIGYEPFEFFADMLSSADVTLAVLSDTAAEFSVPSKILAYLCAGRPIVAAMAANNQAAQTIAAARAGMVVTADDSGAFIAAVRALLDDPTQANALGANGRAYAEESFGIERIARRFEEVLRSVVPT